MDRYGLNYRIISEEQKRNVRKKIKRQKDTVGFQYLE